MSLSAFLRENPDAERGEIREALAGNLCRCTGYAGIVEAIARAQRTALAVHDPAADHREDRAAPGSRRPEPGSSRRLSTIRSARRPGSSAPIRPSRPMNQSHRRVASASARSRVSRCSAATPPRLGIELRPLIVYQRCTNGGYGASPGAPLPRQARVPLS